MSKQEAKRKIVFLISLCVAIWLICFFMHTSGISAESRYAKAIFYSLFIIPIGAISGIVEVRKKVRETQSRAQAKNKPIDGA